LAATVECAQDLRSIPDIDTRISVAQANRLGGDELGQVDVLASKANVVVGFDAEHLVVIGILS